MNVSTFIENVIKFTKALHIVLNVQLSFPTMIQLTFTTRQVLYLSITHIN